MFFDSHRHTTKYGACFAYVEHKYLLQLCEWIVNLFLKIYEIKINCYELSFLTKKGVK